MLGGFKKIFPPVNSEVLPQRLWEETCCFSPSSAAEKKGEESSAVCRLADEKRVS